VGVVEAGHVGTVFGDVASTQRRKWPRPKDSRLRMPNHFRQIDSTFR
jgi:hypothetical protein